MASMYQHCYWYDLLATSSMPSKDLHGYHVTYYILVKLSPLANSTTEVGLPSCKSLVRLIMGSTVIQTYDGATVMV